VGDGLWPREWIFPYFTAKRPPLSCIISGKSFYYISSHKNSLLLAMLRTVILERWHV
jgi:hypothetical protein